MKKIYKKISAFGASISTNLFLRKHLLKGASRALLICSGLILVLSTILAIGTTRDPWVFIYYFFFALGIIALAFILDGFLVLAYRIPRPFRLALLISVPIFISISYSIYLSIFFTAIVSIVGVALLLLIKMGFKRRPLPKKVTILLGLFIGIVGFLAILTFYLSKGFKGEAVTNAALVSKADIPHIPSESPATKGPYAVKTLSYGSGRDNHRMAYGAEVDIKTNTVDGSVFIDNWSGFAGKWRTKFWGFDAEQLPLNAKVWYPEGEGPFPLALIVHGDHDMQDFSEEGYAYLGELLASRGIVLASVDENFLNISWSDFRNRLGKENDARAWLLLEHLRVWHAWNTTRNHRFFNKIDTENIALIGHSRGGESIVHAALFNKLEYYPDNALVRFDYEYAIKALVAIAPVDGQYLPAGSRTLVKDINYLVLHGSQDGEVSSYHGSKQFERIHFSDSTYHFKSGLYIHGANHGQFNTTWGDKDAFTPFKGMLNLEELMAPEDQRKIAEVYIGAFLETTLKNNQKFLPLFADARTGSAWLPETIYLNQFEDSRTDLICTFDEDFDLSSTTLKSGAISAENLSLWREEEIGLKSGKKGSRAVVLGWNHQENNSNGKIAGASGSSNLTSYGSTPPKYKVRFATSNVKIDSSSVFVFSVVGDKTNPDLIDFTIELQDTSANTIRFPLSDFSYVQKPIETSLWKKDFLLGITESEYVFQTYSFSITNMLLKNPDFDYTSIESFGFIFDRSKNGRVMVDNIGFRKAIGG
ncbi:MAG: hypothetical protein ACR2MT_10700 [Aurantibacter sp.]